MSELTPMRVILNSAEFKKGLKPTFDYKEIPPNNKDTSKNKVEIPLNNMIQFKQRKCKVLRDFIEFPISKNCLKSTITKHKGKTYMEKEFLSLYGQYKVKSLMPFNRTLFDLKVLLVISYLADFFTKKSGCYEDKDRFITISYLDFIKLLGIKNTGQHKRAIKETLDFYTNTTYETPYLWDLDNHKRNDDIPLTDEGNIDYSKLKSFSVWHLINAYHFKNPNDLQGKPKKRCYNPRIEIELSREFYYRFLKYYILIDFKKTVSLKNPTSLNLYLFLKNNWGIKSYKYSIGFDKLKDAIDITDKDNSSAKNTFIKAWSKLKKQGLLSNYNKEQVLLSNLDYYPSTSKAGKENINFTLVKVSRA